MQARGVAGPRRTRLAVLLLALFGALLLTLPLTGGPRAVAAPGDPTDGPTTTATSTSTPTRDRPTRPTRSSRPPTTAPTTTAPPTTAPPTGSPRPTEGPTPTQPPPFSDVIDGAAPGQEGLAAEALALSLRVVETTEALDRLGLEAEAAGDTYRQAEAEVQQADADAERARIEQAEATAELQAAQDELGAFARNSYINGSTLSTDLLVFDATSPADLIERAGLLESVATSRLEVLATVEAAQARSDVANEVADDTLAAKEQAEEAARVALADSEARLAAQQDDLDELLAQKTELDAQFYAALVELLGPEGAADAFAQYQQDQLNQQALEAAARQQANSGGPVLSGDWALPLRGTLTSCFCERWGTMHWGIDIAAPMYTPMYSAGDGVVIQAGEATGFGQAVYIQHTNGDVTVYGHMEVIEVVTGQVVAAGQEIALVGSRGFSTGPHLHFEVHLGGINGTRVDPVGWLANRGVYI